VVCADCSGCSSLVEEDKLELAKSLEASAAKRGVKIILPTDVVLADKFAADANTKVASVNDIPAGWMGLDNGPESTKLIQKELSDCKTIIWNGPMGVFEFDKFAAGTNAVAQTLAECTAKVHAPLRACPDILALRARALVYETVCGPV
jgi:phosphoglycerate kinase